MTECILEDLYGFLRARALGRRPVMVLRVWRTNLPISPDASGRRRDGFAEGSP
jgi:hypothetical protein